MLPGGVWGKAELWCCSRISHTEAAPSATFLSAVCCQIVGQEPPMLRMFALNGVLLVWEIRVLVSAGGVRVPAPRASDSTVRLQEHSNTYGQNRPTDTGVGGRFWVLSPAVSLVEGHCLHRYHSEIQPGQGMKEVVCFEKGKQYNCVLVSDFDPCARQLLPPGGQRCCSAGRLRRGTDLHQGLGWGRQLQPCVSCPGGTSSSRGFGSCSASLGCKVKDSLRASPSLLR